jgi:hypothetical protein
MQALFFYVSLSLLIALQSANQIIIFIFENFKK